MSEIARRRVQRPGSLYAEWDLSPSGRNLVYPGVSLYIEEAGQPLGTSLAVPEQYLQALLGPIRESVRNFLSGIPIQTKQEEININRSSEKSRVKPIITESNMARAVCLGTMNWKTFFLLIFIHHEPCYINSMRVGKHPHRRLIERTYDTRPKQVIDSGFNIGIPLILTPYIENHKIIEARDAARVDDQYLLPGTESYAGYLTVNKIYNGNLWFWYFPVANTNRPVNESPLIIWLQGGPGSSSLFGLFKEIGPFAVINETKLTENKYSWGKNHSLLFIDNPVGTGFSFTDDAGYAKNQTTIGESLYTALQQFLTIFPEMRTAPLFIAGESYAGKHVPSLAIQILRHKTSDELINLQGLMIGNGFIDPISYNRHSYFAYEVGLVDKETANNMSTFEIAFTKAVSKGELLTAYHEYGAILGILIKESKLENIFNYLSTDINSYSGYTEFVQRPESRYALHVGNTTFSNLAEVYDHLMLDFMNSVKHWIEEILDHYRVLVYNGHLDCMVPYDASVHMYNSLKYSGAQNYNNARRFPWYHNHTLAGYFKVGGNLLEVMVRGAGHMVPIDKPAEALGLITAFIRGITLDEDTGSLVN